MIINFLGRFGPQTSTLSIKRRTHQNSTGSPDEDERSTDEESDEEEELVDGSDVDSNSDTDSDDSESEVDDTFGLSSKRPKIPSSNNNNPDNNLFNTLMGELDDGPEPDIDPFHHDFSSAGLLKRQKCVLYFHV